MRNIKGFTLIELAIVIMIIGILSAVAVPKYLDMSRNVEITGCKQVLQSMQSAAAIYVAQQKFVPNKFSDFVSSNYANSPYTFSLRMLRTSGHVTSIDPEDVNATQFTVNLASGPSVVYFLNGSEITADFP